jgi:hypothetical protein
MGKATQREIYFSKHIRNQPTADSYLNALKNSPYRTHQRMGFALAQEFEAMIKMHEEKQIIDSTDVAVGPLIEMKEESC